MTARVSKQYDFNGLAGCVIQKKARATGSLVGVYNSEQSAVGDSDPSCAWMTVCEVHNTLVGHASLKLAMGWSVDPTGWCQFCRARNNRYTLDTDPKNFDLNDFLKNNEGLGEGDKEDILRLDVGESLQLGGGAAAEFTLKRVS